MKTGLFFGSFNPVHIGHLAIANYFVAYSDLGQLWFIVSPHNPLKQKKSLLDGRQRLEMLHRAVAGSDMFRVNDIEFHMPQPSYTIDTLARLGEKYPEREFALIMGADNLDTLDKWKNYEELLDSYAMYVYPRPGLENPRYSDRPNVRIVKAPQMEVSSSFIRQAVAEGRDLRHFMPPGAWQYMDEMNFYR